MTVRMLGSLVLGGPATERILRVLRDGVFVGFVANRRR
jgi:hypothetical protein